DLNSHVQLTVGGKNLILSFDTKWVNQDYPGSEFRIFGAGSLWRKNVGNSALGVDAWDHIEEEINTTWSDLDATANGWIHAGGASTFAQTMANVTELRIDFQGIAPSSTTIRYDNISITSFFPEPATLALVGLGGLMMLRRKR